MAVTQKPRDVYLIDGSRTPFLKAKGVPGPFSASDLAVHSCRNLLLKYNFEATDLSEIIAGCTMPSADEANIGRIIALRLGCGNRVPGWTVQRNCASGMQALDNARQNIALGYSELVLAGGCEAMSRAPLIFSLAMANWLGSWMSAKSIGRRLQVLAKLRPSYFVPIIALLRGLTDPIVGLSMGQTAEIVATRFNISRHAMDEFAMRSHHAVSTAHDLGFLEELVTLYHDGEIFNFDDGVRRDSSLQKLGKLKPYFDKKYGDVTPGNSSQVTDGAAFILLASEQAIDKYKLTPMAKFVDCQWAALDPAQMGLGPIHAMTPLLQKHNLGISDIDFWEINEAFAAQVLGCIKAWQSDEYCQTQLGLQNAMGKLEIDKLNVDGGAIALGHPIGASGARITLHLMKVLQREKAKRGVASLCVGGGQGGAVLIERA